MIIGYFSLYDAKNHQVMHFCIVLELLKAQLLNIINLLNMHIWHRRRLFKI